MQFHGRTFFNPAAFLRQLLPVIALAAAMLLAPDARAAETVAPLTTPSPIMGTYGTTQNVTLTCSDGSGSGCSATFYCLGSGCTPTTPYSGPVSIAASTSLSFFSIDLDGNSEQVRTYAYTVDPTLAYRFDRLWPQLAQPWHFSNPLGIATDSAGNIYVADYFHHRIQKFDADGAFVVSWGSQGGGNGQFYRPSGVAVGPDGHVYVTDTYNYRIQKFTANGSFVAAWGTSGGGNGQFAAPQGVAVDSNGAVYVADSGNHRIQKFSSTGSFLSAWGGSGSGNGQFNTPSGITVDPSGNIYVADTNNHRLQKFDSSGTFVTAWGSLGNGTGQLFYPKGLTFDKDGALLVADSSNSRIQKFTPTGTFVATWGGTGQLALPSGIASGSNGNIAVTDTNNNRIQIYDSTGSLLSSWGSKRSESGTFNGPTAVTVAANGSIYIVDRNNHRVQRFAADGSFLSTWGEYGTGNGQFSSPRHITTDPSGAVYVSDTGNNRIQKFTADGSFLTAWGTYGTGNGQFRTPHGIDVDSAGIVYVADWSNNRIQKFTSTGTFVSSWGSSGSSTGQFSYPGGITIDTADYVYVADGQNNRIQKFTATGTFVAAWGSFGSNNGQFKSPEDVTTDAAGNIYVTDNLNYRVQKFTASGGFITAWGSFGSGNGQFNNHDGITLDAAGNVYIADTNNNRVQKFVPASLPATPGAPTNVTATAGNGQATVSFTAPAFDGGSPITSYTVTSSPGGIAAIGPASPIVVTGLTNGTPYTFSVIATNANSSGTASNPSNPATPHDITNFLPGAPTGVTATADNGFAIVSFTPPASTGGSAITSYTVTSNPVSITATGTASPIIVGGLANGTPYTFTVTAANPNGSGPASAPSNSVTPAVPSHSLSVMVNGPGTVRSSPSPDIACSGSCGQAYPEGSLVTLTASPASGYTFTGWSGACSGRGGCTLLMYYAQGVTATFSSTIGNGMCGTANNSQAVDKPATSLCANGTPSAVSGIGPWAWTCSGGPGGSTANCSATQAGGVFYRSFDDGATWTGRVTGIGFNTPINALAPSPCYNAVDFTIFIGAGDGVYQSLDSGDSWTKVHSDHSAQAVALSPYYCSDNTLFAGFMLDGIQRSTDGGTTWSSANSGLPNTLIRSLAVSTGIPGVQAVFTGILGNGVYKSTNNGSTWSSANSGISTLTPLSLAVSPNYPQDNTLFAATTDGQYSGGGPHYHVYRSTDGGGSWTLADSGLAGAITKLELSEQYATDQTLFAVTGSGIYRSTDSGTTWTRVNTSTAGNSLALSKDYKYDHILFAGIYGDNVYKSADSGTTWTPSSSDFATVRQLSALAISPVYYMDKTVFATAYFAGPQLSVSPGSLSFGNVAAGTSSTSKQVTIANGQFGDANLAISSITITGTGASRFTVSPGTCGSLTPILAKGAQCTIDVTFTPAAIGSTSATLQIASNAVSMPDTSVSLDGSGTGGSASSIIYTPFISGNKLFLNGTASCSAGDSVALVEVSINGGFSWQPVSGTTSWNISLTLPDGSYQIKSRATTGSGNVESPGPGVLVTLPGPVDTDAPTGTLALYNGVWTLNANSRDGQMCLMVYPIICGQLEMSLSGGPWQPATTTPGTGGPITLRDRAGNISQPIYGVNWNSNGGPIRVEGGPYPYYSFLQHALNAVGSGTVLKVTAVQYSEALLANTNTTYTVRGGYNSSHSAITGTTQLNGSLTVQTGTLTVENLDVAGSMTVAGGAVTANAISIQ